MNLRTGAFMAEKQNIISKYKTDVKEIILDCSNQSSTDVDTVNMLLSAFSYRKKLSFAELVEKVLADGKKAICNVSSLMEQAKNKGK
jgi:hypothetical protein